MDDLAEGLIILIFWVLVVAIAVFAVLYLVGVALWFALAVLISVPASAGAYGLMWGAEHWYSRRQLRTLQQRGKLGDMIHVCFADTGIEWSIDEAKLEGTFNPLLLVVLFAAGTLGISLFLYLLAQLGAYDGLQLGLVANQNIVAQINQDVAYLASAAAIGIAMVLLPRHLHRALRFQAAAIVQGRSKQLDHANSLFCKALASYNEASRSVAQTGSVTLIKELDQRHLDLHSTHLADCIRQERWVDYEGFTEGLIADFEGLKQIAQEFETDDESGRDEAPKANGGLTEPEACHRLGVGASASSEEINKAWKALNKKFNTTQRQDLEAHVLELLEERNKLINEAHQFLKQKGRTR